MFSTFDGFGVWTTLMARYPATQVAPFTLLVPPAGIAAAWLWLGESPTAPELLGAALVLGGLALTVGLTAPSRAREARRERTRRGEVPCTSAGAPLPQPQSR